MFIRNCWYVAAWDSEVANGQFHTITIINQPLLIYRKEDGEPVVMEDRCCHRFAPLSKGKLEDGCNVRCMYHGLKFAPDGTCIEIPGQDKIPGTARVRTYPVEARGGWIWVWMGDKEKADTALIPPAIGPDDPRYVMRHGWIDYKANYQLINDNLTDLSHVVYVHANSFGGGRENAPDTFASERPNLKVIDRGIRVWRWLPEGGAELQADSDQELNFSVAGPSVQFSTYDYLAPGVLLMFLGTYRPEDKPADGISPPTAEPLMANFTSQAVTPMTEGTTRYFFCWGPRSVDGGDAEADFMFAIARKAFDEDREMIEAQQAVIDLCGPAREVITTADVGPVQMRAVLRKLYKAEQANDPVKGREDAELFAADQ